MKHFGIRCFFRSIFGDCESHFTKWYRWDDHRDMALATLRAKAARDPTSIRCGHRFEPVER
jgi:hypothetical protein